MSDKIVLLDTFTELLEGYLEHTTKANDRSLSKEERKRHFEIAFEGAGILQGELHKAAIFVMSELAHASEDLDVKTLMKGKIYE